MAAQETINFKICEALLNTWQAPSLSALAKMELQAGLKKWQQYFSKKTTSNPFAMYMQQYIQDALIHPADWKAHASPVIPDGAPIGMDCY